MTENKIKLAVAVAGNKALPSAFVVFRGFETYIRKAAEMGFDGIELALKTADEIPPGFLSSLLDETGMEVSCISTGQVFADTGLMFTDPDPKKRMHVIHVFREMIDLASGFGQMVNIGRVRGFLDRNDNEDDAFNRFLEVIRDLCDYARTKKVTLILEPINRYETNFINTVAEGVNVLNRIGKPNLKLMPDLFHMNIEDREPGEVLTMHIDQIAYLHFADSNRLAPGRGHINFHEILKALKGVNYSGWCSLEILPIPSPEQAALEAIQHLRPLIDEYNKDEPSWKKLRRKPEAF